MLTATLAVAQDNSHVALKPNSKSDSRQTITHDVTWQGPVKKAERGDASRGETPPRDGAETVLLDPPLPPPLDGLELTGGASQNEDLNNRKNVRNPSTLRRKFREASVRQTKGQPRLRIVTFDPTPFEISKQAEAATRVAESKPTEDPKQVEILPSSESSPRRHVGQRSQAAIVAEAEQADDHQTLKFRRYQPQSSGLRQPPRDVRYSRWWNDPAGAFGLKLPIGGRSRSPTVPPTSLPPRAPRPKPAVTQELAPAPEARVPQDEDALLHRRRPIVSAPSSPVPRRSTIEDPSKDGPAAMAEHWRWWTTTQESNAPPAIPSVTRQPTSVSRQKNASEAQDSGLRKAIWTPREVIPSISVPMISKVDGPTAVPLDVKTVEYQPIEVALPEQPSSESNRRRWWLKDPADGALFRRRQAAPDMTAHDSEHTQGARRLLEKRRSADRQRDSTVTPPKDGAVRPASGETQLVGPAPRSPIRDQERRVHRRVVSWQEIRRRNVVMQQRDFSCGAAALATVLQYYWGDTFTEEELLKELDKLLTAEEIRDRIENGLTLTDLRRLAVEIGYQASIGKLEFEQLAESKVPVIVGIEADNYKHFVVFRGTDGQRVYLADPIRGNLRLPIWEFQEQWQQNALLAVAKPKAKIKERSPLSVTDDEIVVGELNRQLIRKNFLFTPPAFPTPLRP